MGYDVHHEPAWKFALALCAALALAAWIRTFNLDVQIIGGDELHALHAAATRPLGKIVTTYEGADNSIPITAVLHGALSMGWWPSEGDLRALPLLSGLLLVGALPWWVRGRLGGAVAGVFAVWLAVSPGLVLYSRIFRSYMPMVLLACGAAVAAERWWRTGSRGAALAYVGLGAGALWLHLGAGPFVAAPLIFAALWRVWEWMRRTPAEACEGPAWRAAFGVGFALLCFSLAFLIPARESLVESIEIRRQHLLPSLQNWGDVAQLQAGTGVEWAAVGFATLAALGWTLWFRRQPRLALYSATLVACQVIGLLMLRPLRMQKPVILNRYLLPCLPILLLWASCALVLPWQAVRSTALRRAAIALSATLVIGGLVALGPFADPAFRGSSFVHHNDYVGFHRARGTMAPEDVPAFYGSLSPDSSIVEAPWDTYWNFARAFRVYQEGHGARVRVSGYHPTLESGVFDLDNFVARDVPRLAAAPADWVVVHLDVGAEEERIVEPPGALREGLRATTETGRWARLRREGEALAAQLEARWGAPDHSEPALRAWRLPRPQRSPR